MNNRLVRTKLGLEEGEEGTERRSFHAYHEEEEEEEEVLCEGRRWKATAHDEGRPRSAKPSHQEREGESAQRMSLFCAKVGASAGASHGGGVSTAVGSPELSVRWPPRHLGLMWDM